MGVFVCYYNTQRFAPPFIDLLERLFYSACLATSERLFIAVTHTCLVETVLNGSVLNITDPFSFCFSIAVIQRTSSAFVVTNMLGHDHRRLCYPILCCVEDIYYKQAITPSSANGDWSTLGCNSVFST